MENKYFNHTFDNTSPFLLNDLENLQMEGCTYSNFADIGYCRINFEPKEIVEYVEAAKAYNEFLRLYQEYGSPERAINNIKNSRISERVKSYNEWASSIGQETQYCFAAFLGKELESLTCGSKPSRYEALGNTYTGDRRFLLKEILNMFPQAVKFLKKRRASRPSFDITCEQDVQDLLLAVIKCTFPDAKREEYTPKHAGGTKKIDIIIPKIKTLIEVKFIRDKRHSNKVGDELKIDIESYHTYPSLNVFIAYIWDEEEFILDKHNFISDLEGKRIKEDKEFKVEVFVGP